MKPADIFQGIMTNNTHSVHNNEFMIAFFCDKKIIYAIHRNDNHIWDPLDTPTLAVRKNYYLTNDVSTQNVSTLHLLAVVFAASNNQPSKIELYMKHYQPK